MRSGGPCRREEGASALSPLPPNSHECDQRKEVRVHLEIPRTKQTVWKKVRRRKRQRELVGDLEQVKTVGNEEEFKGKKAETWKALEWEVEQLWPWEKPGEARKRVPAMAVVFWAPGFSITRNAACTTDTQHSRTQRRSTLTKWMGRVWELCPSSMERFFVSRSS